MVPEGRKKARGEIKMVSLTRGEEQNEISTDVIKSLLNTGLVKKTQNAHLRSLWRETGPRAHLLYLHNRQVCT